MHRCSAMKKAKKAVPQSSAALVISKTGDAPLSKNQQAFNKLTARIEKLQSEIVKKGRQYDEALLLHGKEIVPLDEELARQSRTLLSLLFPYYQRHQLRNMRPLLKELLQHHLQIVLDNLAGEPDAELKNIFQQLEGESYDAAAEREEKEMHEEMESVFKSWGMDVDLQEEDMDDEARAAKMAEVRERIREKLAAEQQRAEEQRKTRPKTAKQLQKEKARQAAEEGKQKNLSTLYRQLAKLLHPDLEQDEERRAEKAVLMQEVTRAYEAKDLHALLMLELKWIHGEQSHLETVADEKLALYLQILREQAAELGKEKWQLINHPRYHVLVQRYGYRPLGYPLKAVKDEQRQLASEIGYCRDDIAALQTPQAVRYLKAMLQQWKEQRLDPTEDLFSMLFSLANQYKGGRG